MEIKRLLRERNHNIVIFRPAVDPTNEMIWEIGTSTVKPIGKAGADSGETSFKKEIENMVNPGLMYQGGISYDFEETGIMANPIPPKRMDFD